MKQFFSFLLDGKNIIIIESTQHIAVYNSTFTEPYYFSKGMIRSEKKKCGTTQRKKIFSFLVVSIWLSKNFSILSFLLNLIIHSTPKASTAKKRSFGGKYIRHPLMSNHASNYVFHWTRWIELKTMKEIRWKKAAGSKITKSLKTKKIGFFYSPLLWRYIWLLYNIICIREWKRKTTSHNSSH